MSFDHIINILDLYGFKPQLFIGGFQRSGSLLGLISTILSIIMGLSISIYFFLKLFNTRNKNNIIMGGEYTYYYCKEDNCEMCKRADRSYCVCCGDNKYAYKGKCIDSPK